MEQENRTVDSIPAVSDPNGSCLFTNSFSSSEVMIQVSALGVILVLSLLGNILLIFVVLRNKCTKKSSCNDVFLLNMAISDMVSSLTILPREITVYYTMRDSWPFEDWLGDLSCKMYAFIENVSPNVTVLTLICMTVDRFFAVVFPTKVNLISEKTRNVMIISTWIVGSATSSTYLFAMSAKKNIQGQNECIFEWPRGSLEDSNNIFMGFNLLFYFLIPLTLMIVLYSLILTKLKAKNHVHSSQMARKRMKIAKRVTFMTVCVIGIFLLFFGPFYFIMMLLAFYWKWNYPPICSWPTIMLTVKFLILSHSAFNPFICVFLIENHRRKVKKALRRAAQSFTSSHLRMKNILGSASSFTLRNVTEHRAPIDARL